jgi:proteasome accessory factor A
VRGIETEYGVAAPPLTADEVAREMFAPVVAWGRSTNVFTPAGARLYLDVGSHPEYATAESASLADLLAQDLAGDRIMWALADHAAGRLGREVAVFKNNSDSAGHSFGSHENYQVARSGSVSLPQALIPFLVTRQLVAGAGLIQVNPSGARYVLSARADHISESLSAATTRARPMINTRDEPHADGNRFRRLHVIVGDSNMSQAATAFRFGATSLVIRAVGEGHSFKAWALADPVRAIREVSHGWRQARPVRLADGRSVRPVEIQRAYLEAANEVASCGEDTAVIGLWRRCVDGWERLDFAGLETELDWLAKLRLIERYRERSGLPLADPKVIRLTLAYHQLGPVGLRGKLEAADLLWSGVDQLDAAKAVLQPPPTTRAYLRGRFVRAARAAGSTYSADWTRLKLGEYPPVVLLDPLEPGDQTALDLINQVAALSGDGQLVRTDGAASANGPAVLSDFDRILEQAANQPA